MIEVVVSNQAVIFLDRLDTLSPLLDIDAEPGKSITRLLL
jgi:hypothetical protein